MSEGWRLFRLGEVCPISNRKPEVFDGMRPYFSTGAVGSHGELSEPVLVDHVSRPNRAGCMPEVGHIGFARMKGTRKAVLIDDSLRGALFSTGFCFLAPRPVVNPRFAFYFVTSDDFQDKKDAVAGDGIMGGIKNRDAAAIEIPVPDLAEQNRIVGLLDEAFEGLATAQTLAERNYNNALKLFDSHLRTVFSQRGKGWVTAPLADCLELITYGFTNPMPTVDAGPYMITAKNVIGGRIDYASARRTSQKAYDTLLTDKSRPRVGDVLLTKDGTLGRVAVVDQPNTCINQSVALLRPNSRMKAEFMRYLLSSADYQQRMVDDAGGTTIKHIYITRVDKMPVTFPESLHEQQRIAGELDALGADTQRLITLYERKKALLALLKQSLLHHAFNGKL